MKKKLFYLTILLFLGLIFIEMFLNTSLVMDTIYHAITLWKEKLFPSLFPFLVFGEVFILLGLPNYLSYFLEKPCRALFHLSGNSVFALIMSLFSGFPSGPKFTKELYLSKNISKEEGNLLLKVVHFSNPLFILGTISLLFQNQKVILSIFIAHYLANFLLLFFLRGKKVLQPNTKKENLAFLFTQQTNSFSSSFLSLLDVIQDAIQTLLFMLGSICFFMLLSTLLNTMIPNSFIHLKLVLTGFLDLTSGIFALGSSSIPLFLKGLLATGFLAFGSCSVHLQVLNVLKTCDLSYRSFLQGRILGTLFSMVLYILIYGVV